MEFQPDKESWDSYAERLNHFFTASKIEDDEKKVFTLIHQNGPSLYTLLKELSFPTNPTLMSYDGVMGLLQRHYVGAKSVFYERKVFYNARMKPYEPASEWHRRLRGLAISCDFGGFVEEILLDKFITGFHGKVLHRLYEEDATLSLQQALEIAQRYENDLPSEGNRKGNKEERARSQSRQRPQQHDAQGHQQQQPQQRHQQQQKRQLHQKQLQGEQEQQKQFRQQQGHQENRNQSHPRQQDRQPQPQYEQPQQTRRNVPTCYKCGRKGHYANECRTQIQRQEEKAECSIS